MLAEFTQAVISKTISEQYSHLKEPAVMLATITQVKELDDTYTVTGLQITNTATGTTYPSTLTGKWHEYAVRIVDKNGDISDDYPEIPGVRSKIQAAVGATVAVALLYGMLDVAILGEVAQ
jgi:hypothetical protein